MVQRYDPYLDRDEDSVFSAIMVLRENGDYYHRDDYAALEQRCRELMQEIVELEAAQDRFPTVSDYENMRDDLDKSEARCKEVAKIYELSVKIAISKNEALEAENALLRKRLEPIEAAYNTYKEYPTSAIVKRDAYDKAINQCMELKDGE